MKTVGYRSRSLPSHASRPQVRKSHSMRTAGSTFKPPNTSTPPGKSTSPYAQPIRPSRSHSTAGEFASNMLRVFSNSEILVHLFLQVLEKENQGYQIVILVRALYSPRIMVHLRFRNQITAVANPRSKATKNQKKSTK